MIRWSIVMALLASLPFAALGGEGGSADPRGSYFCLRSAFCRNFCPTGYDANCSQACRLSRLLCQAYRANDQRLFSAALVGWASLNFLKQYRKQQPGSEPPPINTVGQLVRRCASAQPLDQAECVSIVGAWATMMVRNGRRRQSGTEVRRPGAACVGSDPPSDADVVRAFTAWAASHPSQWDRDGLDGLDTAISEAWPCPKPARD